MGADSQNASRLVASPHAAARLSAAQAFAGEHAAKKLIVVAPRIERARAFVAELTLSGGVLVDVEATTLDGLALRLARRALAAEGLALASGLAVEAAAAQALVDLAETLPRMGPLAKAPGMPRALGRTLSDIELADVSPAAVGNVDAELGAIATATTRRLAAEKLVSRARLLELARVALADAAVMEGVALVVLDVALRSRLEAELVVALLGRARASMVTVPLADRTTLAHLAGRAVTEPVVTERTGLLAASLFTEQTGAFEDVLVTRLARGEAAEAAEVARSVLEAAREGTPLHRIAIALRRPEASRAAIETALEAAGIRCTFSRGARRPDPTGRAFLALLGCAADGLSASGFSAYLSYGVLPESASGAPPEALPPGDRFAEEDEEEDEAVDDGEGLLEDAGVKRAIRGGTLRAPRRWESLLVDAAVVGGGVARWTRRIAGLREDLGRRAAELERAGRESGGVARDIEDLDALARFALPLITDLEGLPAVASLAAYREALAALATRALAAPERVLAVLGELAPMARAAEQIALPDLVRVLAGRLSSVEVAVRGVGVAIVAPGELRGTTFDVVIVPGLAERAFPLRVSGDPLLPDEARAAISADLPTAKSRAAEERLLLSLSVGAATKRVIATASIVGDNGRSRVPSVYFVELLGRRLGRLPTRGDLASEAERAVRSIETAERAARTTERNLAIVTALAAKPAAEARGRARYLVSNRMLHAALARRHRREQEKLTPADGLVEGKARTITALAAHRVAARAYSATALESLAACPYRFFLRAVLRLSPQETAEPLDAIDPMQRGSIFHEAQFRTLTALRDAGMLPLTGETLAAGRAVLDATFEALRAELGDRLVPSIPRVFDDELDVIVGDLREWLARVAQDAEWVPAHFELAVGSPPGAQHDPASRPEPLTLSCGVRLRGSIDLVERRAADPKALRATDHKTGSSYAFDRAPQKVVVRGGKTLQPALYAMALEALFPDAKVEGGRLYFCTPKARYASHGVALDETTRAAMGDVVTTLEELLAQGMLPAVPEAEACMFCDYRRVCGPDAARRAGRIAPDARLEKLVTLRRRA
jgi:ATP-dependent helicase/nuclease subunit B